MDFENEGQRRAYEERQKKLQEMKARKKLVNYLRHTKNGLGLVEIHKLLVDCGYREEK